MFEQAFPQDANHFHHRTSLFNKFFIVFSAIIIWVFQIPYLYSVYQGDICPLISAPLCSPAMKFQIRSLVTDTIAALRKFTAFFELTGLNGCSVNSIRYQLDIYQLHTLKVLPSSSIQNVHAVGVQIDTGVILLVVAFIRMAPSSRIFLRCHQKSVPIFSR